MSNITLRATKGVDLTQSELDANFKKAAQAKISNYTIVEADNRDTVEFTGTFTATLPDATAIAAASDTGDFEVTIKNISTGTITIGRANALDTIDGTAADISLTENEFACLKVNQAGTGYNIISISNDSNADTVDGLEASQFLRADANTVATGNLTITNAAPQLILNETDGGLDQKKWKLLANTEALQGTAVDDADANAATWLIVQRSGTGSSVSIDSISLGGTIINLAGTFQYNGVSVTSTAAKLNYNDIATLGTVEASKTVTADASGNTNFPATKGVTLGGGTDVLSEYEEGTWTPTLQDASLSDAEGQTYSANGQVGEYTRIGNIVFFSGYLSVTSIGTTGGDARIAGLPFTSKNTTNLYHGFSIGDNNLSALSNEIFGLMWPNTNYFYLTREGSIKLTVNDFNTSGDNIKFSGHYQI